MLSFVALSAGALVSCGGGNSNPNQLNVICLDKGYGKEWIEVAKTRWEAANPDYKINLQAVADAPALIKQHLASSKNQDDLYISVGADWKTYASQGKFANLDSFIDETVDGVKVKEK